jgi:hypothetical protein
VFVNVRTTSGPPTARTRTRIGFAPGRKSSIIPLLNPQRRSLRKSSQVLSSGRQRRRFRLGKPLRRQLDAWRLSPSGIRCECKSPRLAGITIYGYLAAVFAIVEHYKVRRRTKKLLRHAFKFANLPFDKNANQFTAVIRCTCDDTVDSKTISKWARALRYVAHCKIPRIRLKKFMKEAGGVNACAGLYAKYFGRRGR